MRQRVRRLLTYAILAVVFVLFVFLLYYLVATSLKTHAELYLPVPTLIPQNPTLESYTRILFEDNMYRLLINSIIAAFTATAIALAIAFAICYPVTRLPVSYGARSFVLNWSLSLRFLAPIAVVIPYFILARSIGLYNQLLAIIVVYTIFNLPLSIWMLKGFMQEIPMEIEEAALVDGASRWKAVRSILLPLARTGLLAAGVVVFAFDWSEFLFAFVLSATPQSQTFPVGVQSLVTQFEIIWNDMAAGGVIAIVIPLTLMIVARRYVVTGLTFGVIRDK